MPSLFIHHLKEGARPLRGQRYLLTHPLTVFFRHLILLPVARVDNTELFHDLIVNFGEPFYDTSCLGIWLPLGSGNGRRVPISTSSISACLVVTEVNSDAQL
jgi:hypothetical protein